jgi:GNAT superfamily N-acetyltransferase
MNEDLRLVSIYDPSVAKIADIVMIAILLERDGNDTINISHARMPTLEEHHDFVASQPYQAWYAIMKGSHAIGTAYLSKQDEIGIFILREHQNHGYGARAVRLLMAANPRGRFLANINPRNRASVELFQMLGFRLLQMTYKKDQEPSHAENANHSDAVVG